MIDEVRRAAEELVSGALVELGDEAAGFEIEEAVVERAPAPRLLESAEGADLLILGSRGHGGFDELLLGSVSQQCAQHAVCPLVIVPPAKPAERRQRQRPPGSVAVAWQHAAVASRSMLPLRDTVPGKRFPAVTVGLIAANVAVWLFYQVPVGLVASVDELGFQPCEVEGACRETGLPWAAGAFTSTFTHAGWDHIVGNMVFLAIFGNNVEDALGHARFLVFYLMGGLAATALQTWVTLQFGSVAEASIPSVGASGAIAAVLGAYIVLHPGGGIATWIFPTFVVVIPAVVYLGLWIVLQIVEGGASLTHPEEGGGTAYFAHIGGFIFGVVAIKLFSASRPARAQAEY